MTDAPLAALVVVLVFLVSAVLVMTAQRCRREGGQAREDLVNEDPAIREARNLRVESRETRIRIEANVAVGKPTAELFDRAMNLKRDEEGDRGREDS